MRPIDFFDRGARLFGGRVCMRLGDSTTTYDELADLTHRVAAALRREGIGRGCAVAVLSPNDPLAFAAVLGVMRSGAAWVPVNAKGAVAEHVHLAGLTGCNLMIAHESLAEHARVVADQVPGMRVVTFSPGPEAFGEWLPPGSATVVDLDEAPDALVVLAGTGGTTGLPKAVALTERVFETMVIGFNACLPYGEGERPVNLIAAPMTHGAGMMTFPVLPLGGEVVVTAPDPASILAAIEEHRVTQMFLPPTLLYKLIDTQRELRVDTSSLKYLIYGGAPMSVQRIREAVDVFGPVLTQLYGLTEAPIVGTHLSCAEHAEALADPALEHRLYSCGRPTLSTRVEVMAEDGSVLGPGEHGEIVLRGGIVMAGYHGDEEATRQARAHGWCHTGDVGYRDEDGFVYIVDRLRDLIISGGFNVFPTEVEQVVHGHPAVADCVVVGVPDEKWGEAVRAVIELRPGAVAEPAEIIALCRDRLGPIKAPKSVEFWATLPRSPNGKVLRRDVREHYWAGQSRRV